MKQFCLLFTILFAASTTHAETVSTVVGNGQKGFSGDGGPAASAQLNNPFAVARGPDGKLYICDVDNHRIRRDTTDGTIETYVGNGKTGYTGDGGPATGATLHSPYEMAWDKDGHLFFVDIGTHTVRRVDAKTQQISTIAGNGKPGFGGDGGPAAASQLSQPHSLAFDTAGRLYVCDIANHRVRKIDLKTGLIETWSGTGEKKTAADGSPITGSPLNGPRALAFTPSGQCWLALREGNAVMLLDPAANTMKREAGTGVSGFSGNGGPALKAQVAGPKCVALDAVGNVYLADTESHSIRYIDLKKKTLEVLVGDGMKGDGPDGDHPLKCRLGRPHGVFVDPDGAIYIGDSENHRIRVWRK
jgi:streptogramin lyase